MDDPKAITGAVICFIAAVIVVWVTLAQRGHSNRTNRDYNKGMRHMQTRRDDGQGGVIRDTRKGS